MREARPILSIFLILFVLFAFSYYLFPDRTRAVGESDVDITPVEAPPEQGDQGGGSGGPPPGGGTNQGMAGLIPLSGYAWAGPEVGWVNFRDTTPIAYGVEMDTTAGNDFGKLSGYAWSSNIGWIKFDSTLLGPSAGDEHGAQMDSSGNFTGWARACAVFSSGCSGSLKPSSQLGGWDGWIKFAGGTTSGGTYGAAANSGGNPLRFTSIPTDSTNSYVWGGDGFGWMKLCDSGAFPFCVRFAGLGASCWVSPSPASFPLDNQSHAINWHTTVTGGTAPYSYVWSGNISHTANNVSALTHDYNDSKNCGTTAQAPETRQGYMTVTDSLGTQAYCQAVTTIYCDGVTEVPSAGGNLSEPSPTVVRITSQPLGSPAISSETKFHNQDATNATVRIIGAQSVNSSVQLASFPGVQCRLLDTPATDSTGFGACVGGAPLTLGGNGSTEAHFNIRVDSPAPLLLNQSSPYKITVSASSSCNNPNGLSDTGISCGNAVRSFLFDYAVGSVSPI